MSDGFVFGRARTASKAVQISGTRDQKVMRRRDATGCPAHLDHDPSARITGGIVEHDQKIDIRVRTISPCCNRTEQNDLDRVKRCYKPLDQHVHPSP